MYQQDGLLSKTLSDLPLNKYQFQVAFYELG